MGSGCVLREGTGSVSFLSLSLESSSWLGPHCDWEFMGKSLKITNISHGTQICTREKNLGRDAFADSF